MLPEVWGHRQIIFHLLGATGKGLGSRWEGRSTEKRRGTVTFSSSEGTGP